LSLRHSAKRILAKLLNRGGLSQLVDMLGIFELNLIRVNTDGCPQTPATVY